MFKTARLLTLSIVVLVAAGACGRAGAATPTPAGSSTLPAGESTLSLTHGGRDRSYIVYVPASVDASKPAPLVFVLHGGTGNARSAIVMSGFNTAADRGGFVAVYPNGTGPLPTDKLLTWNGGNCCGYAQQHNVDDVGFVRAIEADLQRHLAVDARRIYATGMSNGAILAQRLGCEAADLFAAIAPVAGTLNFSPCKPSRPVSVIEFHGTADTHIPYDGGFGPDSLVHVDFASVHDSITFWVAADGCGAEPPVQTDKDIRHQTWTGCAGTASVELYAVVDGGHAWPGGRGGYVGADKPSQTISATSLMWAFFAAHPMA
jgi:polyhydroxybutyrate depolymerase